MRAYDEKFQRNQLSAKQQDLIRRARFAIVGLGGTGGFILENLIRLGAEDFLVFDHDRFELSNFNRQSLATEDFLDLPKVHAAVARAKSINDGIRIETRERFDPDSDLSGAKMLLDGSDNIKTKLDMARLARREGIPFVFSSAQGSRGIVSVFTSYRFEKAFQLPSDPAGLDGYSACSSILCPSASLSGALAASQAINILLRKPYVRAPEAIFFDLFRKEPFWRERLG